jgi:hypothetical protein
MTLKEKFKASLSITANLVITKHLKGKQIKFFPEEKELVIYTDHQEPFVVKFDDIEAFVNNGV